MSFGRDTTAANIKPLEGAIVQKVQLGGTTSAGELITLASTGKWSPTDATSTANLTVAIAVQAGVDTDWIDAVVFGPVKCLLEGTPGGLVYASNTAGEPGTSAGGKDLVVGWMKSATVLFVAPQIIDFS